MDLSKMHHELLAIDTFHPFYNFGVHLRLNIGYFQVIHMPDYCYLGTLYSLFD